MSTYLYVAHSNFATFGAGTHLHVVENMTIAGSLPRPLVHGDVFPIQMAPSSQLHFMATVASVIAPQTVIIELDDGTAWEMTPLIFGQDMPPSIQSPGLHSFDWVVRRKVK